MPRVRLPGFVVTDQAGLLIGIYPSTVRLRVHLGQFESVSGLRRILWNLTRRDQIGVRECFDELNSDFEPLSTRPQPVGDLGGQLLPFCIILFP